MTAGAAGHDAVIVLPGLMGSELVDVESGRVVWGLADPRWYVRAWTSGSSLKTLRVTEDERAGQVGRIRPTRLLQFPAFAPMLRGFEPYAEMTSKLRQAVNPDAVLAFAYDWRLSVEHNARLLAVAAERHLDQWRARADRPDAQLLLVAHSMGGLVARYFTEVLGGGDIVRSVVTLGTPFYGAVKALSVLGTGAGIPIPRARVRALVSTMPGLHDLLPSYRCVDEGGTARRLTTGDIENIGGDRELAAESFDRRERLLPASSGVEWWPLVGVQQDTMQSVVFNDGIADARSYSCELDDAGVLQRVDRRGDGTVYRESASLPGAQPMHVPQTHGALAARAEGITHAVAVATVSKRGAWLAGEAEPGLEVPDVVTAGKEFEIAVTGLAETDPLTCYVYDANTNRPVAKINPIRKDDRLVGPTVLPNEGLYRVEAKSGGLSAVTEVIMVVGE
jgi:pimeloyl-ACP methyl ester carboxylesterase